MPQGDKGKYTDKQKRMERHIEEGYERKGVGKEEAERRAWATVNAQTGGGNKPGGSGRGKRDTSSGSMSHAERSRAAKKGWGDTSPRGQRVTDALDRGGNELEVRRRLVLGLLEEELREWPSPGRRP